MSSSYSSRSWCLFNTRSDAPRGIPIEKERIAIALEGVLLVAIVALLVDVLAIF